MTKSLSNSGSPTAERTAATHSRSPWKWSGSVTIDMAAADRAVSLGTRENVLYPSARVYLLSGRETKALALATQLSARLEQDSQAYAELIRPEKMRLGLHYVHDGTFRDDISILVKTALLPFRK